jgi:hypothetical protein
MKAKIRKILRHSVNFLYEQKYKVQYANKIQPANRWDGSYDGLFDLAVYLIKSVVDLSNKKKRTFVLPPSFQTSVHKNKIERSETFARSFIGAAYILNAKKSQIKQNDELLSILHYYRNGILEATDPKSKTFWGHNNHLLLENTSIIIGLLICNDTIWESYQQHEKEIILKYLESYTNEPSYQNNWLWCKVFHLAFLELHTNKDHNKSIISILNDINKMHVGNGWYTDGHKEAGGLIDYYSAWTFNYYGQIFAKYFSYKYIKESSLLIDIAKTFADSYEYFFTSGGTHPIYGRSQLYKFSALAPFGYLLNNKWEPKRGYSELRHSLVDEVNIFLSQGGVSYDGFLTMGVTFPDKDTLEHYSASGSTYWAFKALSLLLVDPESLFWKESSQEVTLQEQIITLPESYQIIMHDGRGSILLADFNSFQKSYKWKYNKLVFSNLTSNSNDNIIYNSDNNIWFESNSEKVFIDEIVQSKCIDGHGTLIWKTNKFLKILVQTDLIAMPQGYIFLHQIISKNEKANIKAHVTGFGVHNPEVKYPAKDEQSVFLSCKQEPILNSLFYVEKSELTSPHKLGYLSEKKGAIPKLTVDLKKYTFLAGSCMKNIKSPEKIYFSISKSNDMYMIRYNKKSFNIKNIIES